MVTRDATNNTTDETTMDFPDWDMIFDLAPIEEVDEGDPADEDGGEGLYPLNTRFAYVV